MAVRYGDAIALKANDLARATEWAGRGLPCRGGVSLGGESEFMVGQVAFARGDLAEALKCFQVVKSLSGLRYDEDADPMFRKFLDEGVA